MKFCIEIPEVHKVLVEVDAPKGTPREQLVKLANKKFEEGDTGDMDYSHTLDEDEWTVRTEAGDVVA